jgi:ABC-type nitrate/sulfonate/bicarbonate transport system permease component
MKTSVKPSVPVLRSAVVPDAPKPHPLLTIFFKTRLWLVLLLTLLLWQLIVQAFEIPQYLLPAPRAVVEKFMDTPRLYLDAFRVTAIEAIGGFLLGAGAGIVIAVLIARSRLVEELLFPYLTIIRVMPIVAIAPLLIIWFGHGMTPMIIVSALIVFFPVVVNTVLGLRSVDPDLIALMKTLNAKELQILFKIRFPFALPYILSSFRIAAPGAVIGALVGEFVGGTAGLGYVLVIAHGRIDTAAVFLMVTMSVLLGLLSFGVVIAIEKRVLRWHPSTMDTT